MTPQELDEIRTRCDAATSGPWLIEVDEFGIDVLANGRLLSTNTGRESLVSVEEAIFIANARSDIPDLLAEVERLRELILSVEFADSGYCSFCDTKRDHVVDCPAFVSEGKMR